MGKNGWKIDFGPTSTRGKTPEKWEIGHFWPILGQFFFIFRPICSAPVRGRANGSGDHVQESLPPTRFASMLLSKEHRLRVLTCRCAQCRSRHRLVGSSSFCNPGCSKRKRRNRRLFLFCFSLSLSLSIFLSLYLSLSLSLSLSFSLFFPYRKWGSEQRLLRENAETLENANVKKAENRLLESITIIIGSIFWKDIALR